MGEKDAVDSGRERTEPIPCPDHPTFDLDALLRNCLDEDLGDRGDVTSLATVEESVTASGAFLAKEGGVVEEKEERYRVTKITARRGWAIDQIKFEYR